jgi:hypothetical protein
VAGADGARPLEPYVSTRTDPSVRVGAKAGAGLNWRLGWDVTLFGAYEVTTAADGGLSSGVRAGSDPSVGGHEFTYGIRLRF